MRNVGHVVATVTVVAISVCSFFCFSRHHVEPAADRLPASIPIVRWEIDINSATWRKVAVMRGVGPVLVRLGIRLDSMVRQSGLSPTGHPFWRSGRCVCSGPYAPGGIRVSGG